MVVSFLKKEECLTMHHILLCMVLLLKRHALSLSMMMIQRNSPLELFCSRDTFIQGEWTLFLGPETQI